MSIDVERLFALYTKLFERSIRKFPGTLPVAVTKKNAIHLHYGYLCTLKADGERVFVILVGNVMILHKRDGVTLTFDLSKTFKSCVFDAEYVESANMLLLFDTLVLDEVPAIGLSIEQRVELANYFLSKQTPAQEQRAYAHTFVKTNNIKPIPTSYDWGLTWQLATNGLKVQVKPLYDFHDAHELWNNNKMLPYACDGLIFTRLLNTYVPFTDEPESVLKWKPVITIDFYLSFIANSRVDRDHCLVDSAVRDVTLDPLHTFTHPADERHANYKLLVANDKQQFVCASRCVLDEHESASFDQKIAEFRWDAALNIWIMHGVRDDKKAPNALTTFLSSCNGIIDNLSAHDLVL